MVIKAVYFTQAGYLLAQKLQDKGLALTAYDGKDGRYRIFVKENFAKGEKLLFIGAVGIAVRAIAPYICSKDKDPAVVVVDDKGQYAIPLLSGHLGGANRLAQEIAAALLGNAVITTATDIHGVFAADEWAAKQGMPVRNIEHIKHVSSKLLRGERVCLHTDEAELSLLPKGVVLKQPSEIYIGTSLTKGQKKLHVVPKCCVLGVGCRKGIDAKEIEDLFAEVCKEVCEEAFYAVASIDLKKEEAGLLAFCEKHKLGLYTFSALELQEVPGQFSASDFVKKTTGVDNVCERSAVKMTGKLLLQKQSQNGVTMAVGQKKLDLQF